jgi:hypothetical protein
MRLSYASIAVALCALAIAPATRSEEGQKYTVVSMEYFGAIDHPIYPVVVSNSYGGAEWYRNALIEKGTLSQFGRARLHVASLPLLRRLIAAVESEKGGIQQELEHRSGQYNGISVTIVSQPGRKTYLFHVEQAMSLLDRLGDLCRDDKSLHSDLLEFKESVRPWGNPSSPIPVPQ